MNIWKSIKLGKRFFECAWDDECKGIWTYYTKSEEEDEWLGFLAISWTLSNGWQLGSWMQRGPHNNWGEK